MTVIRNDAMKIDAMKIDAMKIDTMQLDTMRIEADFHVHLYPSYDLAQSLSSAYHNLQQRASKTAAVRYVIGLAERKECDVFSTLASSPSTLLPDPFALQQKQPNVLLLQHPELGELTLVAGRQIVSIDRLEVLGIGLASIVADGLATDETIEQILAAGALPVVNWAPGKWLGRRGKIVAELITRYSTNGRTLLLGDTALRPVGWSEPRLMSRGASLGLPIIGGSDPLPFAGEEQRIGTFGTSFEINLLEQREFEVDPWGVLRTALQTNGRVLTRRGERLSTVGLAYRWVRNEVSRRT